MEKIGLWSAQEKWSQYVSENCPGQYTHDTFAESLLPRDLAEDTKAYLRSHPVLYKPGCLAWTEQPDSLIAPSVSEDGDITLLEADGISVNSEYDAKYE